MGVLPIEIALVLCGVCVLNILRNNLCRLTSTYCEGSVLGVPDEGMLYFGHPSAGGRRANYSIHSSTRPSTRVCPHFSPPASAIAVTTIVLHLAVWIALRDFVV